MRKQLTNAAMLGTAQRRLAEHMATRPATDSERHAVEGQHDEGRKAAASVLEGMRQSNLAMRLRMRAAAWSGDMATAWESTRVELKARVDHYQSLVDKETGA